MCKNCWRFCFLKKKPGQFAENFEEGERLFLLQVSYETASSGGPHPAASAASGEDAGSDEPCRLITRMQKEARQLLDLLSDLPWTHGEDVRRASLAKLLLYPVLKQKQTRADGTMVAGSVDLDTSEAMFGNALDLAQWAREYIGVGAPKQTLGEGQFEEAMHWLQHGCFEVHWMENKELKESIQLLDENTCTTVLNRKEKDDIRKTRREVFKIFKFHLKQLFSNQCCVVGSCIFVVRWYAWWLHSGGFVVVWLRGWVSHVHTNTPQDKKNKM